MSKGVPFNRLALEPAVEAEVCEALAAVARSGWFLLGERLRAFETALAASLGEGVRALGCNSGTDALRLSLLCAGIGPGDEVVTVSHTAIPTVLAIVSVGATPSFVDIDPDTWVMDVDAVPGAVTDRTRAVIPVHLYGNMVDVPALERALAGIGREDVAIIEDVAQAHGSTLLGRQAGTFGRYGAMSFYPTKNLGALGDAGAVVTANEVDANSIAEIRNCGQASRYEAAHRYAMNSRMDECQAAVLGVKLRRMEEVKARKQATTELYRDALDGLVRFQRLNYGVVPHWHLCVVQLDSRARRDGLIEHLASESIGTIIHYPIPNHAQAAYRELAHGPLPNTEHVANTILSIPLYATLGDTGAREVIRGIRGYLA